MAAAAAPPSWVASPDGTRIAVWRTGAGPPLVLVHGTTAGHERWRPVLAALSSSFTVFALDRRGRGGSGDHSPYSIEREFEDVAAVVEAAAKETGRPVELLGHSHGAICSIGGAMRSRHVRRLLLYEPPLRTGATIYSPDFLDRLDALIAAGKPEEALTTFLTEVVRVPPREMALLRSLPMWPGRVASAHTISRECRVQETLHFSPEDWARLKVPVRLLLGGDSPAFFGAAVESVQASLPHSDVVVLPGQQHAAIDTAPDLFVREVRAFFA